jgi:hypothetical protein
MSLPEPLRSKLLLNGDFTAGREDGAARAYAGDARISRRAKAQPRAPKR